MKTRGKIRCSGRVSISLKCKELKTKGKNMENVDSEEHNLSRPQDHKVDSDSKLSIVVLHL